MSKVALSGNASGTGTFTIASPNSNTDRTLTLPDNTGTILTTATAGVPVNGPAFASGSSAYSSVSTGTFTTFSNFGSSVFDTASAFNTTTGRFTPLVAGYYQINAAVNFQFNGITSVLINALIYKNGNQIAIGATSASASVGYPVVTVSQIVYLNGSTDYVQVYTYHLASGTATNVSATISGFLARSAT
jgi:hypothetical protein